MFNFHATIEPEPILDATYNAGRFWKGSTRQVVSMDISVKYKPMIVADNRKMPGVPSLTFVSLVYDPPHIGPQGRADRCQPYSKTTPQILLSPAYQSDGSGLARFLACHSRAWLPREESRFFCLPRRRFRDSSRAPDTRAGMTQPIAPKQNRCNYLLQTSIKAIDAYFAEIGSSSVQSRK